MTAVHARLRDVRDRISYAAQLSGRRPESVRLIAVTKRVDPDAIMECVQDGQRDFGENYLQEAIPKIDTFPDLNWHFLGRLQSNKAKRIGKMFGVVHTLDSIRSAKMLTADGEQSCAALIEVNIAREGQKSGVLPENLDELFESVYHMRGLRVCGLMTMGPANRNPQDLRPYFAEMRSLLERVGLQDGGWLSMGMSADFEVAIQEGATHVRIGSAIFGPRE